MKPHHIDQKRGSVPSINQKLYSQRVDFNVDYVNNYYIRTRKDAFKDFVSDLSARTWQLPQRWRDQKKEDAQFEDLDKRYRSLKHLKDERENAYYEKMKVLRLEQRKTSLMTPTSKQSFSINSMMDQPVMKLSEADAQMDRQLKEVEEEINLFKQRRESQVKKIQSKQKHFVDHVDQALYVNIKNLVDPKSDGAKHINKIEISPKQIADNIQNGMSPDGKKRIIDEDTIKRKLLLQKQNLPKIKAGSLQAKMAPQEPIEPMKKIVVNYKTIDVDYFNFKIKHMVPHTKFQREIDRQRELAMVNEDKNQLANQLTDQQEKIKEQRTGVDYTPFVDSFVQQTGLDAQAQSSKGLNQEQLQHTEPSTGGLPIFENEQYLRNLNKLLKSKDIDQCFDYDSKDKTYKILYDCLSARHVGTEKHKNEKDQKVEESAPLKFDGTISLSLSNDSAQNLGGRKSATPKAVPQYRQMEKLNNSFEQMNSLNNTQSVFQEKDKTRNQHLQFPKMPSIQLNTYNNRLNECSGKSLGFGFQTVMNSNNARLNTQSDVPFPPGEKAKMHTLSTCNVGEIMSNKINEKGMGTVAGPGLFTSTSSVMNQSQSLISNQYNSKYINSNFRSPKQQMSLGASEMPSTNKRYQLSHRLKQKKTDLRKIEEQEPVTYNQLNEKLMFPNNPAYFKIQKLSTADDKKAQIQKMIRDNKSNQTFLQWCQEHSLAFTDTDKVMYNFQTSKDLHDILINFLEKKTKVVEDEEDKLQEDENKQPEKSKSRQRGGNKAEQKTSATEQLDRRSSAASLFAKQPSANRNLSKFAKSNISFTKYGGINSGLDDQEMMKVFKNVMDNELEPPTRREKPTHNKQHHERPSVAPTPSSQLSPIKETPLNQGDVSAAFGQQKNSVGSAASVLSKKINGNIQLKNREKSVKFTKRQDSAILEDNSESSESLLHSDTKSTRKESQPSKREFQTLNNSSKGGIALTKIKNKYSDIRKISKSNHKDVKLSAIKRSATLNKANQSLMTSTNTNLTQNSHKSKAIPKLKLSVVTAFSKGNSNKDQAYGTQSTTVNRNKSTIVEDYHKKHETFRTHLKLLEKSIDDPGTREMCIKQAYEEALQEKKLKLKAQSQDSNSSRSISETSSQKELKERAIKDCDKVYGILETVKKRFEIKNKIGYETNKLMERMDLDRPILQREKFEMIFMERMTAPNEPLQAAESLQDGEFSKILKTQTSTEDSNWADNLELFTDEQAQEETVYMDENKKVKIAVENIKQVQVDRMIQRKQDNQAQLEAYRQMCEYIKARFQNEKTTPTRNDINVMEVLKKIVESGWIIQVIEMKQIIEFLQLKKVMIEGQANRQFRKFLEKVFEVFQIQRSVKELLP